MASGRRLGIAEQAMVLMEQRHGTGHIVRVMRLGGPVTIEMLEEAMRAVQARHPLLRARIVGDLGFQAGSEP